MPSSLDNRIGFPSNTSSRSLLVLGLGNDILTDDGIGLHVVRQLRDKLQDCPDIDVQETSEMGLALLDFVTGYSALLLVDSIQTGRAPVGFVHEVDGNACRRLCGGSPHFLGVDETLALGRQLGLPMPERVKIFAIEVQDPFTLSTEMTPALQTALPSIVDLIATASRKRSEADCHPA